MTDTDTICESHDCICKHELNVEPICCKLKPAFKSNFMMLFSPSENNIHSSDTVQKKRTGNELQFMFRGTNLFQMNF